MTTPPKYDEATELAVRNRVIAEMEADDRAAAHARHGRREVEFWSHTNRFIEQLDKPRLSPDERRLQATFDAAAPVVADADAAPVRREFEEIDAAWGGEHAPWNQH